MIAGYHLSVETSNQPNFQKLTNTRKYIVHTSVSTAADKEKQLLSSVPETSHSFWLDETKSTRPPVSVIVHVFCLS